MFCQNQAAVLCIQLLAVCRVLRGILEEDHRAVFVSRGDSVMLTCNISKKNATLITWTKGRSVFQYSITLNRTFSNFSFQRLEINHELPTELIIFSAQPEHEGLYTCSMSDRSGLRSISWNLTVSENPEETFSSEGFLYILLIAVGFGIMLAVFLCKISWTRTLNKDRYEDRTLSCVQYHVQQGEKVAPPQAQSFAVYMTGSTLRGSVQSVASSGLTRRQFR